MNTSYETIISSENLTSLIASGGQALHGNGGGGGTYGILTTLHTITSLIFLGAGIIHIIFNRYPLKVYMGRKKMRSQDNLNNLDNKSQRQFIHPWELTIATGITIIIFFSCIFYFPPSSWLISIVSI
jgi:hypothetical protein